MGGRYGKYGEVKRKARLRQSGHLKRKNTKRIQNTHGRRQHHRKTGRASPKSES